MGLKEWIIPQDKIFFSLLEKQSNIILQAADLLYELAHNDKENFEKKIDTIRNLEKDGDGIVRDIFYKLNSTFITPIDHEDISTLSTTFDDVLDHIEGVAVKIRTFKIIKPDDTIARFTEFIRDAVREIHIAIGQIKKIDQKEIRKTFEKIHNLENQSDDLYDDTIPKLFQDKDLKKIMILKDLYDQLEEIADICQDVCLIVQDVVIKNS